MQCKSKISLESCARTHAVCDRVHTLALNSSWSTFVLSILILETAVHCMRERFIGLPVFNVCVYTFNKKSSFSFADAHPLCYPALLAHNVTAPVELAIAPFATSLL